MKYLKKFINESVSIPSIFRKQVIYSVDCSDLSSLIQNLYGKNPEIEACLELGHDFEIEASSDEFVEKGFNDWIKK